MGLACGPASQPYGIAVIDGKVWYSESGVQPNTIVMFDPASEKFQTWPIPSGGGVVRNVSVTKDGNLALALSGVNKSRAGGNPKVAPLFP
jgi:virginiamycin B lyase